MALREALGLRRSGNEGEALDRLLRERIQHVDAARRLGQFVQPGIGGRVRQWYDQARLDLLADSTRREVAEARIPSGSTRPLSREGALSRLATWARGGPRGGAAPEVARDHRAQRERYRRAKAQARRYVRAQRQAEALAHLASEQAHHLRASRDLKRQFQPASVADADDYCPTDPAQTVILN